MILSRVRYRALCNSQLGKEREENESSENEDEHEAPRDQKSIAREGIRCLPAPYKSRPSCAQIRQLFLPSSIIRIRIVGSV